MTGRIGAPGIFHESCREKGAGMKKNKSVSGYLFFCRAAGYTATLALFCMTVLPVHADAWGSGHISSIFEILKDMTNLYIKIAYGAMILVFVAGTVKSGLGAQAAQTLGLPKKVSAEIANFALGVIIFVFGVLSYPVAEKIINTVIGAAGSGSVTGLHLNL